MLLWFTGLIFIFYCLIRGVIQGLVMIQDGDENCNPFKAMETEGVRTHVWYRQYHALCLIEAVFCAISGILLWHVYNQINYQYFLLLIGISVLGWEAFEIGYSKARYDVFIPEYENLTVVDFDISSELENKYIKLLHGTRTVIGLALTITGGFLL